MRDTTKESIALLKQSRGDSATQIKTPEKKKSNVKNNTNNQNGNKPKKDNKENVKKPEKQRNEKQQENRQNAHNEKTPYTEKKTSEELMCPKCGKPLTKKVEGGQGVGYGHTSGHCKAFYRSKKEVRNALGLNADQGESQVEKREDSVGQGLGSFVQDEIGSRITNLINGFSTEDEHEDIAKEDKSLNQGKAERSKEPESEEIREEGKCEDEEDDDIEITESITEEEYNKLNSEGPAVKFQVEKMDIMETEEAPESKEASQKQVKSEKNSTCDYEERDENSQVEKTTKKEISGGDPQLPGEKNAKNSTWGNSKKTQVEFSSEEMQPASADSQPVNKANKNSTLKKEDIAPVKIKKKYFRRELLNRTQISEEEAAEMEEKRINVIKVVESVEKKHTKMEPVVEKQNAEEDMQEQEYGKTQLLSSRGPSVSAIKHPTLTDKETGEVVEINKPVFTVGCKIGCDYVIEDDPIMHTVSRKHAQFVLKNETVYIKDLSSNGTFIGREEQKTSEYFRVPRETEVELKDGQIIMFATRCYIFGKEV